jgi:hypothetical protein
MIPVVPTWALGVGAIIALALPVYLDWKYKNAKQKKTDELKVHTAPASPDDIADIDRIQRLQDERNIPPAR